MASKEQSVVVKKVKDIFKKFLQRKCILKEANYGLHHSNQSLIEHVASPFHKFFKYLYSHLIYFIYFSTASK